MQRRLYRAANRIKSMSSAMRISIGILLLIGGMLWFLPVLGLWMIPLGLLVLSFDFPWARRGYLSIVVWLRKKRRPRHAQSGEPPVDEPPASETPSKSAPSSRPASAKSTGQAR